jgi:hypothetical protein
MVKDESGTFFSEGAKAQASDTANPDVMGKWVGVAEKGINLIDQIIKMRMNQTPKTGGESSAYEKGMSQGLQNASAQAIPQPIPAEAPAPTPTPTPTPAELIIDSEGAEKYLFEALGKTDGTKTLKDYLEGDLKEAQEMGALKPIIEAFIKNFTEIKQ